MRIEGFLVGVFRYGNDLLVVSYEINEQTKNQDIFSFSDTL